MFKKVVETIVGGAIGMIALFTVAKVSYSAGHDMAELERKYDREEAEIPPEEKPKKVSKLGLLLGMKRMSRFGRQSAIGELVSNPEDHQLEAYVEEGEVRINIRKKKSVSPRK